MTDLELPMIYVAHEEAVVACGIVSILNGESEFTASRCRLDEADSLAARTTVGRSDLIIADHAGAMLLLSKYAATMSRARPKVLVLTSLDREWDVRCALKSGADGYVLQASSPDQLIEAVRTVWGGRRFVSRELASKLAEGMIRDDLTTREMQVLLAMSTGASNKRISLTLGISSGTVKSHIRSIFNKVGACARTEAVALAAQRGLTEKRAIDPSAMQRAASSVS